MNKKTILIIVILLFSIFIVIYFTNSKQNIPSEIPKYRTIEKQSYILGKFWPVEEVKIKSEISGIIDTVFIKLGDSISVGTEIAKLRIIPIPENIEATKRVLELAKVELHQRQISFNRSKSLFDKGVIASAEFENVAQQLENAKIEYNYALKNYNIALKGFSSKKESRNIIKSTIKGTVIDIPVKKGMNITERNNFNEGNTIAIIANLNTFIFEFEAGETDINYLSNNQEFKVSVKAFNDKIIKAKIFELRPSSENQNSKFSYKVRAYLSDNKLPLKKGFTGLAEFLLEKKENSLTIKEKNIIYKGRKTFVEILDQNGYVKEVEITRGISDGIYTEILSGISKNSKIKIQ